MRDLSVEQVVSRLQEMFREKTDRRQLIFWFDDHGEFQDDVDGMMASLPRVKLMKLDVRKESVKNPLTHETREKDTITNQFGAKYTLEKEADQDFLVYAPTKRPDPEDFHLEDMVLYSPVFRADKVSLVMQEMGISEDWRPVLEGHAEFFRTKERRQRFLAFRQEKYSRDTLLLSMMAVITKTAVPHFDKILLQVLSDGFADNEKLNELKKFNLLPDFWNFCKNQFGYISKDPSLSDLNTCLFVTFASTSISHELPSAWEARKLKGKENNVRAFLIDCMHNENFSNLYDQLSQYAANALNGLSALETEHIPLEALADCQCFSKIDMIFLSWVEERLLAKDTAALLGDMSLPALCEARKKTHFGRYFADKYETLYWAWQVLQALHFESKKTLKEIADSYTESDYLIDQAYRKFYFYYDRMNQPGTLSKTLQEKPEDLRSLVENVYTNVYMGRLLPQWNKSLLGEGGFGNLPKQVYFYSNNLKEEKEKTIVLISDGLRYEVGKEIYEAFKDDPKASRKMSFMVSTLPSYTRLGMEALLPHQKLELQGEGSNLKEMVDGVYAVSAGFRQRVLSQAAPNSACYDFDELMKKNKNELREAFKGRQLIYVYHDRIDNAGEHDPASVFKDCAEAVKDILNFIRLVSGGANVHRFVITSDHGFLYKRDGFDESDKIGGVTDSNRVVKRRYILDTKPVIDYGVSHMALKDILPGNNDDPKIVSFPTGLGVFKAMGSGGRFYVHGGSSPQELLVPLITIKMGRGLVEKEVAQPTYLIQSNTVNNSIVTLAFFQSKPVSEDVEAGAFIVYYTDKNGNPVSDTAVLRTDSREQDNTKRMITITLHMKNIEYDSNEIYYLKIVNKETNETLQQNPVHIQIAYNG